MSIQVTIDIDYDHWHDERSVTERVSRTTTTPSTAQAAIMLLDDAYNRARARLISALTDEETAKVPVMVPVPEYALERVQLVLTSKFAKGDPEEDAAARAMS